MDANPDWGSYIGQVLITTPFMALATNGGDGLWNNPVHYAYDNSLNIYFMSQPSSRHMKHISSNPNVALAIYTTQQPALGNVRGVQIRGIASVLADKEIETAHRIYYGRSEFASVKATPENYMGPDAPWRYVRVTPTEIAYFDSERFGMSSQIIPSGVKL